MNVFSKFGNDGWLNMNGHQNEWAVAFHGVGDNTGYSFTKISLEGLKIGPS